MNKKDTEKMHYLETIRKQEPIRPSELKFKRIRYDYIDELIGEGKIHKKKYGDGYTLLFLPEHEQRADERYNRDSLERRWFPPHQKQGLQFDFKSDIKAWLDQVHIWGGFFTPWAHPKMSLFDGKLPIEYEPTYPFFKEYVKNLVENNPDVCSNPFVEQDKLKCMMKKFSDIRDNIIDEINIIIEKQKPSMRQGVKQSLGEIILIRITKELLSEKELAISPCWIMMHNPSSNIDEDIIKNLLTKLRKSKIITKKSIADLWSMISESQQICNTIIRSLKVLQQVKD